MKATIYISGKIGKDTTLVDVIRQFKSYEDPDGVDVIIHSEGGSVEEGDAIYTYLNGLKADLNVDTYTDKAYSISAKIFAVGENRIVEDVEKALMIHFAWANVQGNAEKLELVAEALREMEDEFAVFYSEFLGVDNETVRSLLDNETFVSGSDSVELGFATETKMTAKAVAEYIIDNSNKLKTIEMKKNEKGFFTKLMSDIQAYLDKDDKGVEINAEMTLQDSNGTDILFPDLESGDAPKVGDNATIDGVAITDGSYIMPSLEESTLVFVGGAITEITEKVIEEVVEVNAEEVQEISVWTMEVLNTSFAVGDKVTRKGWDEGTEESVGSGEFQLTDGRRVVTDATGVIVLIKDAEVEKVVEVDAEASLESLIEKMTVKIKAEVNAEFEEKISLKENEIKSLKKTIGSKDFKAEERDNEDVKKPIERGSQASALLTRKKTQ